MFGCESPNINLKIHPLKPPLRVYFSFGTPPNFESTKGKIMKDLTEIKIQEHLDPTWENCFEGMTIRYMDNLTILQVKLKDQAQLHGILNLIRDLNLKLISVHVAD
jgi:hypothetical protein